MINTLRQFIRDVFNKNDEMEGVDFMEVSNKIRKAARAQGRVQGVGFRFFVQTEAKKLRITGWVRNEDDGSVTMEIQGTPQDIKELENRIKKGNGFAKVSQLDSSEIDVVKGEGQFGIKY